METVFGHFDTDEEEEVDLHEVRVGDMPTMTIGVGMQTKDIYCRGDLHPLGSATALLTAAANHVSYIALSAVEVLYPLDWLKAECMHDADRLRVLFNIENYVRSGFSQGAAVRRH